MIPRLKTILQNTWTRAGLGMVVFIAATAHAQSNNQGTVIYNNSDAATIISERYSAKHNMPVEMARQQLTRAGVFKDDNETQSSQSTVFVVPEQPVAQVASVAVAPVSSHTPRVTRVSPKHNVAKNVQLTPRFTPVVEAAPAAIVATQPIVAASSVDSVAVAATPVTATPVAETPSVQSTALPVVPSALVLSGTDSSETGAYPSWLMWVALALSTLVLLRLVQARHVRGSKEFRFETSIKSPSAATNPAHSALRESRQAANQLLAAPILVGNVSYYVPLELDGVEYLSAPQAASLAAVAVRIPVQTNNVKYYVPFESNDLADVQNLTEEVDLAASSLSSLSVSDTQKTADDLLVQDLSDDSRVEQVVATSTDMAKNKEMFHERRFFSQRPRTPLQKLFELAHFGAQFQNIVYVVK